MNKRIFAEAGLAIALIMSILNCAVENLPQP